MNQMIVASCHGEQQQAKSDDGADSRHVVEQKMQVWNVDSEEHVPVLYT
jgi:hypothetical protein